MALCAVGSVLCGACTVIEKFIAQYNEMKHSNAICKSTLDNLKTLLALLKAVKLHTQAQPEVKNAIERISEKFSELENRCFKKVGNNDLVKFICPNKNELLQIQSDVLQCTVTLNTALQIAAKDDREKEQFRQSHKIRFENMLNPSAQKALEAIVINNPSYNESGGVELSWPDNNKQVDKNYEIEITHETESHGKTNVVVHSTRYTAEPFAFLPLVRYTVRVRAKGHNGSILSPWSDSVIVRVPKAPPNKPSCCPELITYFCSSTGLSDGDVDSVRLSIPYPTEDDCNGAPITKIKVYYSNENTMPNFSLLLLENPIKPIASIKKTVDVKRLDFNAENTFKVVWVNECGESADSDTVTLKKSDAIPGTPDQIRESSKKTDEILKIRWEKPPVNAFAVDHYEVHMMDKDDGSFHFISKNVKRSATIRKLNQNTKYLFRVCSVSKNGTKSSFTPEIIITTNLNKAVKGTLGGLGVAGGIAGGIVGGAVSGPVGGVMAGVGVGMLAADEVDNKVGKAVVGTLAGIAAGIPSVIGMTILTPFTMVAAPIALATTSVLFTKVSMEDNWSEQSSDEDDEKDDKQKKQEYDNNDIRSIKSYKENN